MKRFFVHGICFSLLVCCIVVLFGAFAVSAASLEASTVPDETLGYSYPTDPETEFDMAAATDSASDPGDLPITYAAPATGTEFEDLSFLDVSCNLGDIRLYLPYGVELPSIQLRDSLLYNTTNSTIYLYCPEYPDYTFSASRFQNVTYRTSGSNYSTVDLTGVSITDSSGTVMEILPYVQLFALVFIVFALLWRRSK